MKFLKREEREVTRQDERKKITMITYYCPEPHLANPNITFEENCVFQNPYRHLKSCYEKGKHIFDQEKILIDIFENARKSMTENGVRIYIISVSTIVLTMEK